MRFALCVLTLNAREEWPEFSAALAKQSVQPDEVIVIDSSSADGTPGLVEKDGYRLVQIERKDFNHGGTRQLAADLAGNVDVMVYMTQDAVLAEPDSLKKLIGYFDRPEISAVFGRQLPNKSCDPFERFARTFNYPDKSDIRSLESIPRLGFKTIFFSNSFGAYRRRALNSVGGFPANTNFGEDTQVAARIILSGGGVAYAADATVYHSHSSSLSEVFNRYKQVGIMHSSEPWLLENFGTTSGEGARFVKMEMLFLLKNAPHLLPSALLRTAVKFHGYRVGRRNVSQGKSLPQEL